MAGFQHFMSIHTPIIPDTLLPVPEITPVPFTLMPAISIIIIMCGADKIPYHTYRVIYHEATIDCHIIPARGVQ